ncbi:HD domain-containing protein [Akkermansia muciniphila]|nr:HD domain-containing protein [Akkermansia muciniphila]
MGLSAATLWDWVTGRSVITKNNLRHMEDLVRENRLGLVERAEAFARRRHEGQVRKFTETPYAEHPAAVACLLSGYTGDDYLLAAAWLHDTMEDCGVTYDELADEFGPYVASLVFQLTNDEAEKNFLGKVRYMVRKLRSLPPDALMIKLCDMLHNMTETRSRPQAEKYMKILESVTEKSPAAWNGVHEQLAARIREVYAGKSFSK